MKLWLFLALVFVTDVVVADDVTNVPPGLSRVIVFGRFDGTIAPGDFPIAFDDGKPFHFQLSKNTLIVDLPPGRHYFTSEFKSITGQTVFPHPYGIFLNPGSVAYIEWRGLFMSSEGNGILGDLLVLEDQKEFQSTKAASLPLIMYPKGNDE